MRFELQELKKALEVQQQGRDDLVAKIKADKEKAAQLADAISSTERAFADVVTTLKEGKRLAMLGGQGAAGLKQTTQGLQRMELEHARGRGAMARVVRIVLLQTFAALPGSGTATGLSGVTENREGDLDAFLWALGVNGLAVLALAIVFSMLRLRFPWVYSSNARGGELPEAGSFLGWTRASLTMTTQDRVKHVGLDHALLIEFCMVCMRILLMIGSPLVLVLMPINVLLGSGDADKLSRVEMGNLADAGRDDYHAWVYYLYAAAVWAVCLATHREVYRAQARFLQLRFAWLKHLPFPRAGTLLVQAIPPAFRSDARLHDFFSSKFEPGSVVEAHVIRRKLRTAELQLAKTGTRPMARPQLLPGDAGRNWAASGPWRQVDAIDHYTEDIGLLDAKIEAERLRVEAEAAAVGGVNGHCGFVTFCKRTDATMALGCRFSANKHEWKVSMPPEPSDMLWDGLKTKHPEANVIKMAAGYACIAGLFIGFTPICVTITNIAKAVHAGPLQPVWAAFAPTLGLLLFTSLLPSVLFVIFRHFFVLKADAWSQHRVQIWYFWFQVVYVILVTAIGQSLFQSAKDLSDDPSSIFDLLAQTLPKASHFYMNYLVLQCTECTVHMLRAVNLVKFLAFRLLRPEEEAHELAEPEDQDYHGVGARSTRFTTVMLIGIISDGAGGFSTISPLVAVLTFLTFSLYRLCYGYTVVFAETKKPDLGGVFWVSQLQHVQIGVMIYCVLMIGILRLRAGSIYPAAIASASLLFSAWSCLDFRRTFEWKQLPLGEIGDAEAAPCTAEGARGAYVQPELRGAPGPPG
ncbi:unnamed protein product, partial [Prorocentrum cordatum]